MGIVNEFKEFAVKGNAVDLAVGIILGGAFGTIVKSLVNDVIMPPIGYLAGGIDFASLYWNPLGEAYDSLDAAREAGAPVIAYGLFINNVISFLIVAWAVFLLVKGMNNMKKKEEEVVEEAPAEPPADIQLLTEIRDALKSR